MPGALEIRGLVEPETPREHAIFGLVKEILNLGAVPHVELALDSLGIRIEARIEAALRRAHVPQHPIRGCVGDPREKLIAGLQRRVGIAGEELPVVAEHFLEMRNHPRLIDRVAGKAPAQLIVDAALGHAGERERGHGQRLGCVIAQAALDAAGIRKFGRAPKPAEARIEGFRERGAREREGGRVLRARIQCLSILANAASSWVDCWRTSAPCVR